MLARRSEGQGQLTRVHVIGAGISGLSCALQLAKAGHEVVVHEAAGRAGGRCRSYFDLELGCLIDNGSHMLLGANRATRAYLSQIGALDDLTEIAPAAFPFHDVETGKRWRLRPNAGPIPIWPLFRSRRVPGSRASDYVAVLRLARARDDQTIADCVGTGEPLFEGFWQPMSRAVLNTDANEGSARLLWAMLSETFFKGESACRPLYFGKGLSPTLVDPALAALERLGAGMRFKARLRSIAWAGQWATALNFAGETTDLNGDRVVLAVPADACAALLPGVTTPTDFRAIVNVHFRLDKPIALPWGIPFLGLIGTEAQWIFARDDILSVTISAADRHVDADAEKIAELVWGEIRAAIGNTVSAMQRYRVIKEKRATIAQTPAQNRLRPPPRTDLENVFLAGDWTATGLPATIEGSVRSGIAAADCVLSDLKRS